MLEGKAQITNQRLFDLHHPASARSFHPNIQSTKSSSNIKAYIKKEGDFIDWSEFQIDGRSSRGGLHNLSEVYAEALNATSVEDSLMIIKEKDPWSFYL